MDFFDRQEKARKGTARLLFLFGAGVLALTVAVYLAVWFVFVGLAGQQRGHYRSYNYRYGSVSEPARISLWNSKLFLGVGLGTLTVVALGSLFKISELSRGGSAVATMLGGVPINSNTTDPEERKLLNVVEEMAIASGVPAPEVYILPREQGINAFAAGHNTDDAVIGVTRGAARLLNRDELQGVIAHEFSHILNGDMRINLRLMGFVFGILCLAIIGRVLLYTRGRKNALPVLGIALIIVGWAGIFFGRLIQAAVSRQREYLADASAVQFTRNPLGLASALKKIGGLAQGSRLTSPQAAQASHMFFGNGLGSSLFGLMNTHPPLEERIRALDPSFDGKYPVVADTLPTLPGVDQPAGQPAFVSQLLGTEWQASSLPRPPVISSRKVIGRVGAPAPEHLHYAEALHASLPEPLKEAVRQPAGATALLYALLLSDEPGTIEKQMQLIANLVSPGMAEETRRLHRLTREAAISSKLPLMDLALPALRQLSPAQFQQFRATIDKLVEADGQIDLFEYVLQKGVLRHLEPQFIGARKSVVQFYSVKGLAEDCGVLLSGLAHIGSDDPIERRSAFRAGADPLEYAGQAPITLFPPEQCDLDRIDSALGKVSQAVPQIKKNVLNACALTVAHDGLIKEEEAELLRAIADALDCPMPPFVEKAV